MYFAIFLPDWNSLDSVRHTHSDLELAALVFFALLVVFDVLAHLAGENKNKENLFEKIGLCCFAVAVLAEIVAYPYGQRNDALSAQIIGSLDATAQKAASNASKALTDSRTALSQAEDALSKTGAADGAMKNAANEASRARTAASSALGMASGARQEADSFEKDIVSAKTQAASASEKAADAESHLADALKQASDATVELNRLKSPRILTNAFEFSSRLKEFAGTEYTFPSSFGDQESIDLLKQIDSALQLAGWKRVNPSPAPLIGFSVYPDFRVGLGTSTGVEVAVGSTESIASLNTSDPQTWPALVKAAGTLRSALAVCITPTLGLVQYNLVVDKGSSVVRITVGKKP